MALRDKLISRVQPQLEPGEQIHAVIPGQTGSPWLGALGGLLLAMLNNYRCVVATDRRIAIFDCGKFTMGNPRKLIASLPRGAQLGPATGLWHALELNGEKIRVHKRFHKDIAAADAAQLVAH